jgi:hypothetical protein
MEAKTLSEVSGEELIKQWKLYSDSLSLSDIKYRRSIEDELIKRHYFE